MVSRLVTRKKSHAAGKMHQLEPTERQVQNLLVAFDKPYQDISYVCNANYL